LSHDHRVVSLILCHDRPKSRAKQIEKFADVAQKLRALNNYSALRAFVAGINNSTFPGDDTMEVFISKSPEQAKNLRSWDLLLQHIRSHRAYRMALKNSKGACIPALYVLLWLLPVVIFILFQGGPYIGLNSGS
jgi:RasGEF domain